jgi:excisionase family DNA binding protein
MKNLRSLTVTQIVLRTGIPRATVYQLLESGQLSALRMTARGRWRVLESELEAFIDRHTTSVAKAGRYDKAAARAAADAAIVLTDEDDRNAFL